MATHMTFGAVPCFNCAAACSDEQSKDPQTIFHDGMHAAVPSHLGKFIAAVLPSESTSNGSCMRLFSPQWNAPVPMFTSKPVKSYVATKWTSTWMS